MTADMWIALLILAAAIVLFITEWLRVDVVALLVVAALMLTGLLTPAEALSGFSNTAVLTIAALFIIGGAVMQTGVAGLIGENILKVAGTRLNRLIVVIMLAVALLSGFMSDTGTVAVLLPGIIILALRARLAPSKLLMPLSYGALLGGAATLIGTPPNIIVSDLLSENGLPPFQFFDYTPIGLVLIAVGITYMVLVGQRLLPTPSETYDRVQRVETQHELAARYELADNLFQLRVRRGSGLLEKSLEEARLRKDFNVTILEVQRPPHPREFARLVLPGAAAQHLSPQPDMLFQVDDILLAQGTANDISYLSGYWNLAVQPAGQADQSTLSTEEVGLAEVLLPQRSSLIGKTLSELHFGSAYHLTVLGIRRPGSEGSLDLKNTSLLFGDVLLVQGAWGNILNLRKLRRDFVVMGQPEELVGPPAREKAPLALLILLAMLGAMILDVLPLVTLSWMAALLMILLGCVSIDDAYTFIDWKSIVLIAGMLPMSIALEQVGLVNLVAEGLTRSLGTWGPVYLLGGLILLTSIFTQVLSNTATVVLIAPIGLAAAQSLQVQPQAFLMGIAIAASLAMATPVASPVNTLVMGAGKYRFSDYMRVGIPLMAICLAIATLLLPLLWPF
ncbi:MAG: SLC13 family permease [Anaerolineales bacterium]|jgi:di/tricarboxylate transporter